MKSSEDIFNELYRGISANTEAGAQVLELARSGDMRAAVKLHKGITGAGIKESVDYIRSIEATVDYDADTTMNYYILNMGGSIESVGYCTIEEALRRYENKNYQCIFDEYKAKQMLADLKDCLE